MLAPSENKEAVGLKLVNMWLVMGQFDGCVWVHGMTLNGDCKFGRYTCLLTITHPQVDGFLRFCDCIQI